MIASFKSKPLERFWWKGNVRRVDQRHAPKLTVILTALENATRPEDMNLSGFRFHALTGDQSGRFSVRVNANWRFTFGWSTEGPDAVEVHYQDYH